MKRKEKGKQGDWLTADIRKELLGFLINATPDEIRDSLRRANYEKHTGINPDTLELRQFTDNEIQEKRIKFGLL